MVTSVLPKLKSVSATVGTPARLKVSPALITPPESPVISLFSKVTLLMFVTPPPPLITTSWRAMFGWTN